MCGIAGLILPSGIDLSRLRSMSAALAHRGPDGFGYVLFSSELGPRTWINRDLPEGDVLRPQIGLAHRRLSIIDLSDENAQPMMDSSGRYCVVHNGEIYNYVELREELEQLGYVFRTEGDTEVLLNAYAAWGPDCVNRFNGMWAFALLDVEKRLVFFSRDRFGIKPLYYVVNQDEIAFASEIKGLLAGGVAPVPEVDALARYLVTGLLDGDDRTLFAGVRQLPPGHNAMVSFAHSRLDLHVARYWTLPAEEKGLSAHQAISEFRELFTDSVRVHARSDVPVGTCLSGGVDSSSIVCVSQLLRERGGIPQYTHTAVGYCAPEAEFSELRYMNEVARATGASLHYVDVTTQAFEREVANVIACQDEPFGSASIAAQWFVFRKARELGLKVMLDGQGADEALGGYLHYFAAKGLNLLSRGHLLALVGLVMRYRVRYGAFPLPPNVFSLRRHAARLPRPMAGLLKAVVHLGYGPSQRSSASTRGPFTAEIGERAEDEHDRTYPRVSEKLRIQLEKECLPALLRYEDRNSMAHSIEARVPFLDHRLINLIFRMPERMKIRGVTTKYVLREAMRGVLPETIRTRTDKIGFKASPGLTLRLARENEEAFVRNDTEVENRAFREEGVRTLLRMVEDDPSLEFMLWRVLNTKLWARNHWG